MPAQPHEVMFYEVMWRTWARQVPYPMPWWLQSYFRDWPDNDGGMFGSKQAALRAPALWIFDRCDRIRSDPEDGESVVVGAEVAAGVSDVGASREPEGADRQIPERGDRSRSGTGSDLGVVLAEGDIPGPVEPVLHRPVPALVVAEVL